MKKKAYIIPEATVIVVETAQIIAYSGGSDSSNGDPIVDPDADDSDEDTRSRSFDCWGDDEDWDDE